MCKKVRGLGCCNKSCLGHRRWSFCTLKHGRGSRGIIWGRWCGWDVPATLRSLAALTMGLLTAALIQATHLDDFGTMTPTEDGRSLVHLLLDIQPAVPPKAGGGLHPRPPPRRCGMLHRRWDASC